MRRPARSWIITCSLVLSWAAAAHAEQLRAADATGATHCTLRGYSTDKDPKGTNVRAAPRADAPVIGRLPPRGELEPGQHGEIVGPEFEIVGSRDGWLLIRNAGGTAAGDDKTSFVGPGWISGARVGFTIGSAELRAAPAIDARVVAKLAGETKSGSSYGPDSYGVVRVHGCERQFAEVTLSPPKGIGLPQNALRGWASRVCSTQLTTCDPSYAEPSAAEEEVRNACLEGFGPELDDETCKVAESGPVGTVDGHDVRYAIYHYANKDGVVLDTRALIFEHRSDDFLYVLFAPDADGGRFETPKLVKSPAGLLLHIPGYESGTGNFNREQLYLWRGDAWREIDSTSWLNELQRRLPKGLGAWKGIYPDYVKMKADTPLWRKNDGNASPTGPHADLTLRLTGTRIELVGVKLRRSRKDEE